MDDISENIDEYNKLLAEFASIPKKKYRRTFMEISGYPHYENVCSNILAFFLNPQCEHGFETLLLKSLLECIDKTLNLPDYINQITIHREFTTKKNNRIDLLIETEDMVIVIENKIYHWLANDLYDYEQTANDLAKGRKVVCAVLALSKQNTKNANFHSITYSDFIKHIQKNLGHYRFNAAAEYEIMLIDFLNTISRLKGTIMDKKLFEFYLHNIQTIEDLKKGYNEAYQEMQNKLWKIPAQINLPENPKVEQWKWRDVLVYDFNLAGESLAIDIAVDLHYWNITFFKRQSRKENVINVSNISPQVQNIMKKYKMTENQSRYQVLLSPPTTPEEEIVKTIQSILDDIADLAKKNFRLGLFGSGQTT